MKQYFKNLMNIAAQLRMEAIKDSRIANANNEIENYYYALGKANAYEKILQEIDDVDAEHLLDKCEWKRCKESKHIIISPHKVAFSMFDSSVKITPYCSCCGKEIKITEAE